MDKNSLRQEVFEQRKKLTPEYRQQAEAAIYQSLFDLEAFKTAQTLLCYYATEGEFNSHPIIEKAWQMGKTVGIPRVYPNRQMEAHVYRPDSQLEESAYHIPEPLASAEVIDPKDLDLIIMPCVSCNNQGQRIGYGGGYYDRYILRTKPALLVLPFYQALQRQDIPVEDHDLTMDIIITEAGIFDLR